MVLDDSDKNDGAPQTKQHITYMTSTKCNPAEVLTSTSSVDTVARNCYLCGSLYPTDVESVSPEPVSTSFNDLIIQKYDLSDTNGRILTVGETTDFTAIMTTSVFRLSIQTGLGKSYLCRRVQADNNPNEVRQSVHLYGSPGSSSVLDTFIMPTKDTIKLWQQSENGMDCLSVSIQKDLYGIPGFFTEDTAKLFIQSIEMSLCFRIDIMGNPQLSARLKAKTFIGKYILKPFYNSTFQAQLFLNFVPYTDELKELKDTSNWFNIDFVYSWGSLLQLWIKDNAQHSCCVEDFGLFKRQYKLDFPIDAKYNNDHGFNPNVDMKSVCTSLLPDASACNVYMTGKDGFCGKSENRYRLECACINTPDLLANRTQEDNITDQHIRSVNDVGKEYPSTKHCLSCGCMNAYAYRTPDMKQQQCSPHICISNTIIGATNSSLSVNGLSQTNCSVPNLSNP